MSPFPFVPSGAKQRKGLGGGREIMRILPLSGVNFCDLYVSSRSLSIVTICSTSTQSKARVWAWQKIMGLIVDRCRKVKDSIYELTFLAYINFWLYMNIFVSNFWWFTYLLIFFNYKIKVEYNRVQYKKWSDKILRYLSFIVEKFF